MNVTPTVRSESSHSAERSRDSRLNTGSSSFGHVLESEKPSATATTGSNGSTANVFGLVTTTHSIPATVKQATTPQASTPAIATETAPLSATPTAEEVFGANPWITMPTGWSSGLGAYNYNPMYFATQQTAEKVAQMLGGKVVASNAMVGDTGPFYQSVPNYMVELPNGHRVNAGLTATYFTHGWTVAQINQMLEYDRQV